MVLKKNFKFALLLSLSKDPQGVQWNPPNKIQRYDLK